MDADEKILDEVSDEVLDFKTTLKEKKITVDSEEYIIKELNGDGMSKWRGFLGGKISVGNTGIMQISDIDTKDQETNLLSLCLYQVSTGKLVSTTVLKKWSSSVLEKIFNLAKDLSGLSESSKKKLETDAKN